jgi:hypothetical protein
MAACLRLPGPERADYLFCVPPAVSAARPGRRSACWLVRGRWVLIPVAQAERLISTPLLSFVASEAVGRFRRHDHAVVDENFAELLAGPAPLLSAAPDGSAR